MAARRLRPRIPNKLMTDRLVLRPFRNEDRGPFLNMYQDREMWWYIHPDVWKKGGRNMIPSWRKRNRSKKAYHFIIRTRQRNDFVGEIAIFAIDWEWGHAELGYHIDHPQWGKGYASEAARALTTWAFGTAGLHRLYARPFEANVPSVRLLTRLGFRQSGRRARWARIKGRWEALLEMDLLAEDFHPPRRRKKVSHQPRP